MNFEIDDQKSVIYCVETITTHWFDARALQRNTTNKQNVLWQFLVRNTKLSEVHFGFFDMYQRRFYHGMVFSL